MDSRSCSSTQQRQRTLLRWSSEVLLRAAACGRDHWHRRCSCANQRSRTCACLTTKWCMVHAWLSCRNWCLALPVHTCCGGQVVEEACVGTRRGRHTDARTHAHKRCVSAHARTRTTHSCVTLSFIPASTAQSSALTGLGSRSMLARGLPGRGGSTAACDVAIVSSRGTA